MVLNMFELTGIIRYSNRKGLRKEHKQNSMVIEFRRDDLSDYYQWFLRKKFGEKYQMQNPLFNCHVTIVRGDERGFKSPNWGIHEGRKFTVCVSPKLTRHWHFWYLPVEETSALKALRTEVGLRAHHDYHITVAREYEWQVCTL